MEHKSLKPGDKAPDFKLQSDDGKVISLKDFKGKKVILYFYPKDNTSGCTAEAIDFRDNLKLLNRKNVVVVGVSKDSIESHKKFREKHSLNFTLLSDETGNVLNAYGVWKEKSMYGRKYMGIERTTFMIDEKGKISEIFNKVKVKKHVEDIISKLNNQH
ncbi:MAG: thioredoxin-dependent thiol peroxidase [Ignavibacteria bacterium]|nr:thioredoxin-dependent thiol peroxidase [Ignavibacteria bacterium]